MKIDTIKFNPNFVFKNYLINVSTFSLKCIVKEK